MELVISFDQATVEAINGELSTFFGPGSDFSYLINTLDFNQDFNLNGPSGPVFGFANPPSVENVTSSAVGTTVSIPIDQPLVAGTYQVQLNWGTNLDFLFGLLDASATNQFWPNLANASAPATIAQLTVSPTVLGPTFKQAHDLGTIGSIQQNVGGTLDPKNIQSAVALYKFELPPGQLSEVGLEVSTLGTGSHLLPALSLFDGNGNLLATRTAGTGLPSDPNDPYLFLGLQPKSSSSNTYYVEVSQYDNLFNHGGYNPVTGDPGTTGLDQTGGAFVLSVVALPHNQPTTVLNVSIKHQNPLDPSPSSITLTFSGPIDLSRLFKPDVQETALDVVDSTGRIWPITAQDYQVSGDRLTLVVDQELPPGNYSLIVPSSAGLTDLAGVPVVAPGEPAGVLARWTTAANTTPYNPTNLGTLWPSSGGVVWPTNNGSLSGTTGLAPGQTVTYRWIVIVPGIYKLQTQVAGSEIEIVNSGNGRTTVLDTGSTNYLNNYLMQLGVGVYELKMVNVGFQPARVHWLLTTESLDWEKIIDNGASPSSALSLMTFSPNLEGSAPDAVQGFMSIAATPAANGLGGSIAPVSASLFVTPSTSLIGQPASYGPLLGPEGPSVDATSLAQGGGMAAQSLLPGNGSLVAPANAPNAETLASVDNPAAEAVPNGGPAQPATNVELARLDPGANTKRADASALAQAQWLVRLGSFVQHWFGPSLPAAPTRPFVGEPAELRLAVGDAAAPGPREPAGSPRNRHMTSIAQSDLGAVAGLIMVGAAAHRLRQPVRKWWRTRGQLSAITQDATRKMLAGPHRSVNPSRLSTRVRRQQLLQ
jgi:hypothetical protein